MKFYLKIIFLLAVLLTMTYKIITAMDSEVNNKGVMDSIKENFSVGVPEKPEGTGNIGIGRMSGTRFMQYDNSCSQLY